MHHISRLLTTNWEFLVIVAHLRRFNQKPEWDVRQVLPIRAFFMSAPHLHHSDKKLGVCCPSAFILPSVVSPRWLCTINAVSCRLYVILSATKDLKVCTTIHRLRGLEILHSVQNDRVSIQNDNTERHCEDFSPWQSLA